MFEVNANEIHFEKEKKLGFYNLIIRKGVRKKAS